jgi:hypothetical protein
MSLRDTICPSLDPSRHDLSQRMPCSGPHSPAYNLSEDLGLAAIKLGAPQANRCHYNVDYQHELAEAVPGVKFSNHLFVQHGWLCTMHCMLRIDYVLE